MALETFGLGWKYKFENRINQIKKVFPDINIERIERFKGMLRIRALARTDEEQYIIDCVLYCIERESAKCCEECGKHGIRRSDERLPEVKCLCLPCYALELDKVLSQKN